jgi:hypothetical protein
LGVRVVQATGLDSGKKSKGPAGELFAVLYYSKGKANKWRTASKVDPVWNENFVLPIPAEIISEEGRIMEALTVRLFSVQKGSEHLIGKGEVRTTR